MDGVGVGLAELLRDEAEVEHHRGAELLVVCGCRGEGRLEVSACVDEVIATCAQESSVATTGERRRVVRSEVEHAPSTASEATDTATIRDKFIGLPPAKE